MPTEPVKRQEQHEPQPIIMAHEAPTESPQEVEPEGETVKFPRPASGRRRTKASERKTGDQAGATKDAPETL